VTKGKRKIISEGISIEVRTIRKEIAVFQKEYEAHLGLGLGSVK
jgi:hypothetical protein